MADTKKTPTPRPEPMPLPTADGSSSSDGCLLRIAIAMVVLGAVIVLGMMLTSCAPPPPPQVVAPLYQEVWDTAKVPADLWRGADHPEWASCRYEPPEALCTDRPVTN